MDNLEIELPFDHAYTVTEANELPGTGMGIYYFPSVGHGSTYALTIEVAVPGKAPWFGVFASGDLSAKAKTGVYSTPNRSEVLVVARGSGYLVSVEDPTVFRNVRATPITSVRPIVSAGIIVFATPWDLVAYDGHHEAWRSGRLAVDGLRIVDADAALIRCASDCPLMASEDELLVDTATGRVVTRSA